MSGGWRRVVVAVVTALAVAALAKSGEAAGALAVGSCGAYGYAYDFRALPEAQAQALRRCSGARCRVVATMQRTCAALAVDIAKKCGPHGYAVATRLGPAQNAALRSCYRAGGRDCLIRAFVCDAKG